MTAFNTKHRIMQSGIGILLVLQHALLRRQLGASLLSEGRFVEAIQP